MLKRYWIILFALAMSSQLSNATTIDDLTRSPAIAQVKISPSGKYLALRVLKKDRHILLVLETESKKTVGGMALSGVQEVGRLFWANDERIVFQIYEVTNSQERPKSYGELAAANFDGSRGEVIFGFRASDQRAGTHIRKKEGERAWANIIDVLPEDKNNILISSTPMSRNLNKSSTAQLLNIYTGIDGRRVKVSRFPSAKFLTDHTGKVRMVQSLKKDNTFDLQSLPDVTSEWINLPDHNFGKGLSLVAVSDDNESVFVLDDSNRDKSGLYKMPLAGGKSEHIYTHDRVDITGFSLTTDERGVYALRLDNGYPSYLLFSKTSEAKVFKELLSIFEGNRVTITSGSLDGNFWIVYVRSDIDPGAFYVFDRAKNELKLLFRSNPSVDSNDMAVMEPVEFESFDGQAVSGYFTKATGEDLAPMVVLVHGGPRLRDYWGFDPAAQALAMNGYSVLQINYRGSEGYGNAFMAAGDHHWGDDIQKDIIAGTRWAINNKMAVKGNVCIMGSSFGAYSSVQSAILAPDLYQCVIANAGIYDLSLMYTKGDIENFYFGDAYLEESIGRDSEELARFSPVNGVSKLKATVFIAHGKKDERAPYIHAKRLRKAMDKNKKKYQWFVKSKEGHGFYKDENQAEYLHAVMTFLEEHLEK
ncbi:MAG: prolyl oligopeptidase family serine peptidase [Pseudomonadales bacterium]